MAEINPAPSRPLVPCREEQSLKHLSIPEIGDHKGHKGLSMVHGPVVAHCDHFGEKAPSARENWGHKQEATRENNMGGSQNGKPKH